MIIYRNLRLRCTDMMTRALPRTAANMMVKNIRPFKIRIDTLSQLSWSLSVLSVANRGADDDGWDAVATAGIKNVAAVDADEDILLLLTSILSLSFSVGKVSWFTS